MNINRMISLTQDIKLYEKGTGVMWTDEYISKQLLKAHIDTSSDLASRNAKSIDKIIGLIIDEYGKKYGKILDIGCGPGLYTQRLAHKGYDVTGIDFSENSIDYARNSAKQSVLDIEYRCMNYLNLDYTEEYDLIIMIYCDFCVLSSDERDRLMQKVYRALKPGGMFIFDVYNEKSLKRRTFEKSWEFSGGGFWQEKPYLVLSLVRHYEEEKIVLSQHIVFDETQDSVTYNFWEHYYNEKEMQALFESGGFASLENCGKILSNDNDGVSFFKVVK